MTKNSKHLILMVLLCLARIIIDIYAILLIFKYRVAIYSTLAMIFLSFAFAIYNFDNILTLPNPPIPKITYGEFPFEIVYSVDGEVFQKSDVIICECNMANVCFLPKNIKAEPTISFARRWVWIFALIAEIRNIIFYPKNLAKIMFRVSIYTMRAIILIIPN